MKKWAAVLAGLPLLLLLALPTLLVSGIGTLGGAGGCAATIDTHAPPGGRFTAEQRAIAAAAAQVATQRHLPDRALVVILATGFQESDVRNLTYGDRDSLGWLQQRATWGTAAQRLNPAYAAGKFFDALVAVPGWQTLSITAAAQAVQISAYPNAYAKWETAARQLLAVLGHTPGDQCSSATGGGPIPAGFDAQGNPRTVAQAIAWLQAAAPYGARGEHVQDGCERYMTLAYGWPGGYPTARAHWGAPGPRSAGYSTPPRGALVFWATGNAAGHVALSLGGGVIMSTDFDGHGYHAGMIAAGPITAIDQWGRRLGWRAPNFRVDSEGGRRAA